MTDSNLPSDDQSVSQPPVDSDKASLFLTERSILASVLLNGLPSEYEREAKIFLRKLFNNIEDESALRTIVTIAKQCANLLYNLSLSHPQKIKALAEHTKTWPVSISNTDRARNLLETYLDGINLGVKSQETIIYPNSAIATHWAGAASNYLCVLRIKLIQFKVLFNASQNSFNGNFFENLKEESSTAIDSFLKKVLQDKANYDYIEKLIKLPKLTKKSAKSTEWREIITWYIMQMTDNYPEKDPFLRQIGSSVEIEFEADIAILNDKIEKNKSIEDRERKIRNVILNRVKRSLETIAPVA